MKRKFALYLDDTGSPKPNPKDQSPYFGMGGVLVADEDRERVQAEVEAFKANWNITSPLHGSEIRSKKKNFAKLGQLSEQDYARFMEELTRMVIHCPIIVHACIVERAGYLDRYYEKYDRRPWEMMKSAFTIVLERAAKYVASLDGQLMVYVERMGANEERLLKTYFNELRNSGHPFDTTRASIYSPMGADDLGQVLRGLDTKTKANPMLQVADLCLFPVARGRTNPSDRAYQALLKNGLLVDSRLGELDIKSMGIKYYCFDRLSTGQ